LYGWGFAIVQFFALGTVMFLSRTQWFLTHDDYPGMYQTGYSLRLKHADCAIVIYGDSSSLTGLDPDVIQGITGLKTCNISEGTTIQDVVGSRFPLDTYLENNTRPVYLLAMYTSSIYKPYVDPYDAYQPEGMLYALQYLPNRELYRLFLRRREWFLDFDIWAGRQLISDFLSRYVPGGGHHSSIDTREQRDSRHGVWPYPLPPETTCVRTEYHLDPIGMSRYGDSVTKMRELYGVGGTTVLLNIAPVPDCDTLQQTYREKSEGLHDNRFEALPISFFNEGDVHFSSTGSRYISIEAGNQILALERQRQATEAQDGRAPGQPQ